MPPSRIRTADRKIGEPGAIHPGKKEKIAARRDPGGAMTTLQMGSSTEAEGLAGEGLPGRQLRFS